MLLLLILRLLPWAMWKARRRRILTLGNNLLRRVVTILLRGMKWLDFRFMKWGRSGGIPMWVNSLPLAMGPCIMMVRPKDRFETHGKGREGLMVSGARMGNMCVLKKLLTCSRLLLARLC